MIKYSTCVSCDINNVTGINDIVKPCSGKIMAIINSFRDIFINKPPLPTDVVDDVNTPIYCVNSMDVDDVEGSISYSLEDIVQQYLVKIYPFCILVGAKIWITHTCQETLGHNASWFHILLLTNTSTPLAFVTQNTSATWIPWSKHSFQFLEQSVIIFSLIPVRKVLY